MKTPKNGWNRIPSERKLTIEEGSMGEEEKIIKLDGIEIAHLTHDGDGWQSMQSVESAVEKICEIVGIKVERI